MTYDKLTKYIQETAQTLHLGKLETDYLRSSMEMAYIIGHGEGELKGIDHLARRLNIGTDKELQK